MVALDLLFTQKTMSENPTQSRSEPTAPVTLSGPARKLLFASAHSIVDFSNGAAVASLDVLRALAMTGFQCQAFCASRLDFHEDTSLEKIIVHSGEPLRVRPSVCASGHARLLHTRRGPVPITIVRLQSSLQNPEQADEARVALDFFGTFLQESRPDVLLTYGGDPITQGMIALARARGIAVVFAIHNFAYTGLSSFRGVDYCIAPSEFACRYYREPKRGRS